MCSCIVNFLNEALIVWTALSAAPLLQGLAVEVGSNLVPCLSKNFLNSALFAIPVSLSHLTICGILNGIKIAEVKAWIKSSEFLDFKGANVTKPVNMSIARKIARLPFLVKGMFGIMSTAQQVWGAFLNVDTLNSWDELLVLLNWQIIQFVLSRFSFSLNFFLVTWNCCKMSLFMRVAELCRPNKVKCFVVINASSKASGRTGFGFLVPKYKMPSTYLNNFDRGTISEMRLILSSELCNLMNCLTFIRPLIITWVMCFNSS